MTTNNKSPSAGRSLESLIESLITNMPDEFFDDIEIETFDIQQFFVDLEIPQTEYRFIEKAFGRGLGDYYNHIYGYDKYGKEPEFLIAERMYVPFIFGYGTVHILANKRISKLTKNKIIAYTMRMTDPMIDNGIPYGLMTICSYLVQNNELTLDQLTFVAITMQMEAAGRRSIWGHEVDRAQMTTIVEWLMQQELPTDQLLWWLDYFVMGLESVAPVGRPVVQRILDGDELSAEGKLNLCWHWLHEGDNIGTPPLKWQILHAQANKDKARLQQLLQSAETPADESAEMLATVDKMIQLEEEQDHIGEFFTALPTMGFEDHPMSYRFVPTFAKRLAIPALIDNGEDAWSVCDMFLRKHERDYYNTPLQQGAGDALAKHHGQLTSDQIKTLIERGLEIGQVPVRKQFYKLSTEFFGIEYLQKSLDDNAASIRKWGAKALAKFNTI